MSEAKDQIQKNTLDKSVKRELLGSLLFTVIITLVMLILKVFVF